MASGAPFALPEKPFFLALVLFFYPLVFYLSSPTIRYRQVIDPEVIVLSALGLHSLFHFPTPRKFLLPRKSLPTQ